MFNFLSDESIFEDEPVSELPTVIFSLFTNGNCEQFIFRKQCANK